MAAIQCIERLGAWEGSELEDAMRAGIVRIEMR